MAYRRKDIVGKRFLCVSHEEAPRRPVTGAQPKTLPDSGHSAPVNWKWRAGLVRAATHTHLFHNELQVFIFISLSLPPSFPPPPPTKKILIIINKLN